MSLLQLKVDPALKKAIEAKADEYGVPASSLVRIALVKTFFQQDQCPADEDHGNIFNADRDNKGRGVPIDELINTL